MTAAESEPDRPDDLQAYFLRETSSGIIRDLSQGQSARWKTRTASTYHINAAAIRVCNSIGMDPSDAILWLGGEVRRARETRDVKVQLEEAFRKIAQAEGVMLHAKQKEFFKDLVAAMLKELKPEGGQ